MGGEICFAFNKEMGEYLQGTWRSQFVEDKSDEEDESDCRGAEKRLKRLVDNFLSSELV